MEFLVFLRRQVFYGLELRKGDRILTSQHEYGANFNAYLQARTRAPVSSLPIACGVPGPPSLVCAMQAPPQPP